MECELFSSKWESEKKGKRTWRAAPYYDRFFCEKCLEGVKKKS